MRTSVTANQQAFAHLSYTFLLPSFCVSLKHQVRETGAVVIVSSRGTKDGDWCTGVEGNQRLG